MTHVINLMMSFAVLAPFIFAFSLYRSVFGYFNFALASLYTVGLYGLALSNGNLMSMIYAFLLIGISIFVLSIFQIKVLGTMQNKKATQGQLLIVSLGAYIVFEQVLSIVFSERIMFPSPTSAEIGDATIIRTAIMLVMLVTWVLLKTEFGARVQAIVENPSLSKTVGLNIDAIKLVSFFAILALTVSSGILASSETGAFPRAGFNPAILGFAVALLGQDIFRLKFFIYLGGIIGLQYCSTFVFSASWSATVLYSVLLVSLVISSRINKEI